MRTHTAAPSRSAPPFAPPSPSPYSRVGAVSFRCRVSSPGPPIPFSVPGLCKSKHKGRGSCPCRLLFSPAPAPRAPPSLHTHRGVECRHSLTSAPLSPLATGPTSLLPPPSFTPPTARDVASACVLLPLCVSTTPPSCSCFLGGRGRGRGSGLVGVCADVLPILSANWKGARPATSVPHSTSPQAHPPFLTDHAFTSQTCIPWIEALI